MEINWIILIIVLVCAVILIIYLIKRNMKDKEDVVSSMNETEINSEEDPTLNEEKDSLLK